MNQMLLLAPDILTLLGCGVVAGFLAGLLGIGGGLVLIPTLFVVLEGWDVPLDVRMHICVSSSLVVIVFTNISSVRAHHQRRAVDWPLLKAWLWPIAAGGLTGSLSAQALAGDVLVAVFIGLIFLLAIKMFLPIDRWQIGKQLPDGFVGLLFPFAAGHFSAVLGVGGGSFNVPYMTLFGKPVHQAVGTAAVCGLVIAVTGGIGFVLGSPGTVGLGYMLGYIHLPSVAALSSTAVLCAPLGAWAAHRLSKQMLSWVFGVFLLVSGGRMLASVW